MTDHGPTTSGSMLGRTLEASGGGRAVGRFAGAPDGAVMVLNAEGDEDLHDLSNALVPPFIDWPSGATSD